MREIAAYTKAEWGREKARRYAALSRKRIKSLRQFPLRYPEVELRPGLREMHAGQLVVFYAVGDEAIEIVQVLHVGADFEIWLK